MRLKLLATTLSALAIAASSTLPALAATSQSAGQPGQWGLDQVDGSRDGSYDYTATGAGVDVYVLDTGVDAGHPDLAGRVAPGYDAVAASGAASDGTDHYGHGTHMAGLVAGSTYGVAKGATIIPVKVQQDDYTSDLRYYRAGIQWMIDHHQQGTPAVANMSFDERPSAELDDLVQRAIDDGITVVVAAGNLDEQNGADSCHVSPAENTNAITVGAAQRGNGSSTTWYTGGNPGGCIDLLAPGYNITSDLPEAGSMLGQGAGMHSGTSQATALTSGAAALVLQRHPSWSPAQVQQQLVGTATQGAVEGVPDGVPNLLLNALAASASSTTVTPTTAPAPTTAPTSPVAGQAAPLPAMRVAWAPKLVGSAVVATTVSTDGGGWIPGPGSKQVRWYRVGATRTLVGTSTSYTVQPADARQRLQVCVTAGRTGYRSTTSCSGTSALVVVRTLASLRTPNLSGSTAVGGVVRVASSWSPSPVTLRYQWYRVSASGRATLVARTSVASRTNTAADAGSRLRVLVTASRSGYPSRSVWSVTSAVIHR